MDLQLGTFKFEWEGFTSSLLKEAKQPFPTNSTLGHYSLNFGVKTLFKINVGHSPLNTMSKTKNQVF